MGNIGSPLRFLGMALLVALALLLSVPPAGAAKAGKVNLNTATVKELEALPGVGEATAQKIVAGRPYRSVADLAKAGVPDATIKKIEPLVTVSPAAGPAAAKRAKSGATTGKVDLNTASVKELEALPGVGEATAEKIVAGRPYRSVADLAKAGVPDATIKKIQPLVTASRPPGPTIVGRGKVDLNSASQKDLEALPGVGPVIAQRIIANRPYTAVTDLARAEVPASTIEKITPLVTVEGTARDTGTPVAAPPAKEPTAKASPTARKPPASGMVWVNTASGIYHREGDPWYGKTKEGKYMTEAEAVKAGYRESKQKIAKP